MGRRRRQRSNNLKPTPTSDRDRPARVRVRDETWREFRTSVVGDSSVAEYLGRMVEVAVSRNRARLLRENRVADTELIAAAERAAALRDELVALVDRLEHRTGRSSSRP